MAAVFFVLGIISILYFPVLCVDSRRWNPTFASFWLVFGIFCFLAGFICRRGGRPQEILALGFAVSLLVFLYIEKKILMGFQREDPENLDYLLVLGARVNGRRPSAALRRRLDKAAWYLRRNPDTKVIVSGGQGPGEFLTEAKAMKKVLVEYGFDEDRIAMEDESTSTEENLRFCSRMLDKEKLSVGIVTNDFHIYRSICFAKELGYLNCYGVPADSEAVSLLNYMVREFFAVIMHMAVQIAAGGRRRKDAGVTDEQSR